MPDDEVYLALPYLNEEGLELYTKLILRKLASLVISSSSNINDYENEYSANPEVSARLIQQDIEPEDIITLSASYGVGSGNLHLTAAGCTLYGGIDYEEIGDAGDYSNQVKSKIHIDAGSVLGCVVFPKQFSFGRNINVASIVSPESSLSTSLDNMASLDSNGKIIVDKNAVQGAIDDAISACVHQSGNETVSGTKTFTSAVNIDSTAIEMHNTQVQNLLTASFNANGSEYSVSPISVVAGRTAGSAGNGTVAFGSGSGCTWIGSGESISSMPTALNLSGVDFSADESVIITSDDGVSVYVGCSDDGQSYTKAMEIDSLGNAKFHGELEAKTQSAGDSSTKAATTEFVANALSSLRSEISSIVQAEVERILNS